MKLQKCSSTLLLHFLCIARNRVEGSCTVGTVQASIAAFQPLVARTVSYSAK